MAARSLNKVQLIGNLTRDVELRYTAGGTAVATFGVATNRTYNDAGGNSVETVEFTNIVVWAKLAEICSQLLKKGVKIYVEGRLQTSKWDDKDTGKTMQRTEVVANDMIILSPGASRSNSGGNVASAASTSVASAGDDMGQNVDLNDLDLGDPVSDGNSSSSVGNNSSDETANSKSKEDSNTPF